MSAIRPNPTLADSFKIEVDSQAVAAWDVVVDDGYALCRL